MANYFATTSDTQSNPTTTNTTTTDLVCDSVPDYFDYDAANYTASMLSLPADLWRHLISYLTVPPVRNHEPLSVFVFPCVCRLWNRIEAEYTELWPDLRLRHFQDLQHCGRLNPLLKKRNRAKAEYIQLLYDLGHNPKIVSRTQVKKITKQVRAFKDPAFALKTPPLCGVRAVEHGNYLLWEIKIFGPDNTPYQDGVFLLRCKLLQSFFFQVPPDIRFVTPIYHPNFESGKVCLCYDPTRTLLEIASYVFRRLWLPRVTRSNQNKPITIEYLHHRERFDRMARESVLRHAMKLPEWDDEDHYF